MSQENERRARELAETAYNAYRINVTMWDSMAAMIAKALDEAEARGRPQWRPVSERPTVDCNNWSDAVLTARKMPTGHWVVREGFWDATRGLWARIDDSRIVIDDVMLWAPLPEPPTPTTEEG